MKLWKMYQNQMTMRSNLLCCVLIVSSIIHLSSGCECGLEGSMGRVYNGQEVRAHKYPWLAQIVWVNRSDSSQVSFCGGSLIDDQHVITAAHCVTLREPKRIVNVNDTHVNLGSIISDLKNQNPEAVSEIWVHSKYDGYLVNDIAILTLSKKVQFTQQIFPICLPNARIDYDHLITTGWGLTAENENTTSKVLREIDVSYLTKYECRRRQKEYFLNTLHLDPIFAEVVGLFTAGITHICAVGLKTQSNVCPGDSGGPLMHKAQGFYYLVGTVTGATGPCGPSSISTGIYTRVDLYQKTIKSIARNSCWKD